VIIFGSFLFGYFLFHSLAIRDEKSMITYPISNIHVFSDEDIDEDIELGDTYMATMNNGLRVQLTDARIPGSDNHYVRVRSEIPGQNPFGNKIFELSLFVSD
jgi:hypothetical protein